MRFNHYDQYEGRGRHSAFDLVEEISTRYHNYSNYSEQDDQRLMPGNAGGRFLARERGAFIVPECGDLDIAGMTLSAVVKGHMPVSRNTGSKLLDGLGP